MKALRLALTAARLAAPVLPRDETSAPRRDGSTFDYPSDSSVQQAAHGLLAHGLLLELDGWELGDTTVTCSWVLTHLESEERRGFVLEWPLFTDMPQRAHAVAAAISHCWRHLVMQLLGLRVEPRDRPARVPGLAQADPLDDLPPALGGRGVPTLAPARASARPTGPHYSADALTVLVDQWSQLEAAHDVAEGREARRRTIGDAWARCKGFFAPALPRGAEECRELFTWLTEAMR